MHGIFIILLFDAFDLTLDMIIGFLEFI